MNTSYDLVTGNIGMLISMPHNGQLIPDSIASSMTAIGLQVPDTDWYMDKLYDFAQDLGISIIKPKYSRYVIDLNRNIDGINLYPGANSTELCPTTAFDLSPLYLIGQEPDEAEVQRRIDGYWQPYHQALKTTLSDMKAQYGKVVLLDAHSILSQVPRFFEGQLPDFNFGSANGVSCSAELINKIAQLDLSPYSSVVNGRFKGGYITRGYGNPLENIHAVQLELSQHTYMDEPTDQYNEEKAAKVKEKLQRFVQCLADFTQDK
ncbi:N-formylglutamate deformylase [Colwellia sp. 12G3]|uniref:N-formylglutamate deformylase n=1 Tax=Colwellia sp. 12G3 TaxID=2058299 RepID=UPI000C339C0F|nr:N-formylglutamate deformylase [Colwellia sp. 12G3]PKI12977.1 N-formylglutamate deformylase [Colwellia sp. 12G3]